MSSLSERVDRGGKLALSHSIYVALYYGIMVQAKVVGGNSQTGNSRGRESMGIPREFPFLKWRFLGIPRNSHTGEVYWLYGGDFYLQGGIVSFTGRCLLIAPLNILTCDFKTRRERAPKAAIRGQYEYYRRVHFSFLYCHTSHTLLMSR